jgi:hypothetical protein
VPRSATQRDEAFSLIFYIFIYINYVDFVNCMNYLDRIKFISIDIADLGNITADINRLHAYVKYRAASCCRASGRGT